MLYQLSVCCCFFCAGGATLSDVVQELLHLFQDQVPTDLAQATHPSQAYTLVAQGGSSVGWQSKAASAVMVLSEVLFGASLSCIPHATLLSLNASQLQGKTSSHHKQPHQPQQRSGLAQQQPSKAKQGSSQASEPSPAQQDLGQPQQQLSQVDERAHTSQPQPQRTQQQVFDQELDSDILSSQQQQNPTPQPQEASQHPQGHLNSTGQGSAALCDAPAAHLPHAVHAELEQLISRALEEFSSAGVWRLPTHQEADLAASQTTALTPQVSHLLHIQPRTKIRGGFIAVWTWQVHGSSGVWRLAMHDADWSFLGRRH